MNQQTCAHTHQSFISGNKYGIENRTLFTRIESMDLRPNNIPIVGTDEIGERWAVEQQSFFPVFMNGHRQPRTTQHFTPREIMRRFYDMFKVMISALPAHASPNRDYDFNHGRYLFALGEDDSARGLIAVNLLPLGGANRGNIAYTVTMLQFLLTEARPTNTFSFRVFQLIVNGNAATEDEHRFPVLNANNTAERARRTFSIGINVLLNELIQRTDAVQTTLAVASTNLRSDQRVAGARNAGRAVGHFLQVYQDADAQMNFARRESHRLSGGLFFGTAHADMLQLLEALSLIPFIADIVNGRRVNRNSRFTMNRNANPPRPMATGLVDLLRELEENLSDQFLLYAFAILEDDFGYDIAEMTEHANDSTDGLNTSASTSTTGAHGGGAQLKRRELEKEEIGKRLRAIRSACKSGRLHITPEMCDESEAARGKYIAEREQYHKRARAFFDT